MLLYVFFSSYLFAAAFGLPINESCPSPIHEYPYVVSIESNSEPIGGGSIISRYFVITSANVVEKAANNVDLLSVRTGSSFSNKHGQVHNVCSLKIHSSYEGNESNPRSTAAIAMLRLVTPINFDETHQPIRFFYSEEKIELSAQVIFTAWQNIFKQGNSSSTTLDAYEDVYESNCSEDNSICINAAFGDKTDRTIGRGHPVVNDGLQLGIVAYSDNSNVTFITNVAAYSIWITEYMKTMSVEECTDSHSQYKCHSL